MHTHLAPAASLLVVGVDGGLAGGAEYAALLIPLVRVAPVVEGGAKGRV